MAKPLALPEFKIPEFKFPKVDLDALFGVQKANLAAAQEAQNVLIDAAQAIAKVQFGYFEQAVEEAKSAFASKELPKPEAGIASVKAAAEKSVAVAKEVVDLAASASADTRAIYAEIVARAGGPGAVIGVLSASSGDGFDSYLFHAALFEQAGAAAVPWLPINLAYRHAVDMLENQSGVHVWAMQGNFHNLSSYEQLNYPPANNGRHRVFCALGFTLGNLDNEARFLRDNLSAVSQPGDFLLLDIQLSAGASEPEIRRKEDHAFTKPFPESTKRWLSGPIQRACPDALDIQFQMELDTAVPIQGSYALCAIATVKRTGRADRRFSMFRFKRYDQAKLEQVLDEIGWELIASPAVPDSPGSAVLLLRRRALSLPAPK